MADRPTTLWIPPDILSEIMFYVTSIDTEVGGLGELTIDSTNNDIVVEEIFLLDQTVHGTECELSADGISKLYEELIADGEEDKIGKINFWWHSHADMGAFFSGTDDTTMKEWSGQYQVALVINKKGEMKARLMSRFPTLIITDIPIHMDWLYVAQKEEWEENITNKVHPKTIQTHTSNCSSYRKDGEVAVFTDGAWFKYDKDGNQVGGPSKDYPFSKAWAKDNEAPTPRYKSIHDMTEAEIVAEMDDIDTQICGYLGMANKETVDSAFSSMMDDDEKAALHAMWTEGKLFEGTAL